MARKRVPENPLIVSTGAAAVPARRKSPTATTKRVSRAANVTEAPASEVEAVTVPVSATAPTEEQVAKLAYSFWADRGYQGGSPEEDWLRAEQQLSALSAK
jgi:Protein of unknown function (DUF2934)